MNWTAIIPFKGADRKSRLASLFSPAQRRQLSQRMFEHVRDVLTVCGEVDETLLLSDVLIEGWEREFVRDEGRGLNAELAALVGSRPARPTLIVHADLPLLLPADVSSLLAQAEEASCALAPDRHSEGTNALALVAPSGFTFQFGQNSFALHMRASRTSAGIVAKTGLSFDIDTPDDYYQACRVAPDVMKRMSAGLDSSLEHRTVLPR